MSTGSTERPPSMMDVAAAAGVSHQTVSRVLNGSDKVSTKTRDRVHKAIKDLGYRRNSVARALVTRKSGIIGIITTTSVHHGPTSILLAIEPHPNPCAARSIISWGLPSRRWSSWHPWSRWPRTSTWWTSRCPWLRCARRRLPKPPACCRSASTKRTVPVRPSDTYSTWDIPTSPMCPARPTGRKPGPANPSGVP